MNVFKRGDGGPERDGLCIVLEWLLVFVLCIGMKAGAQEAQRKKCLFVASYHQGYAWQDGIERGLRSVLEDRCDLKQFNMDTKRHPEPEFCRKKALEAKALIELWQPDIVIAADDNASKYLIAPYFKDAALPIVFCGVNWTGEEYGYPYSNATGMIEIAPIRAMSRYVDEILPKAKTLVCLKPERLSETKSCQRYTEFFAPLGIQVFTRTADTMDEFEREYRAAQQADVVLLVNNSSMNDWDAARAQQIVLNASKTLSVTLDEWMVRYAMLGLTTVPEEQGEYAAEVALKLLDGAAPGEMPVVANRRWNTFVNKLLLQKAGIRLPASILQQAEKVE